MTTILVVEDIPAEQDMLSLYLEQAGYTVMRAGNGVEALAQIEKQRPDVVITDLVMPEMNGLELCRALRKNSNTTTLPIIACTCKNQELDRKWGLKQGLNLYLTKPYTPEEVLKSIETVL